MSVLLPVERRVRASWKRRLLLGSLLLVLLLGGAAAVAVYKYDRARTDRLAADITIGGVQVGGMNVQDARAKVSGTLLPRYRRPLVITHGGRRVVLKPSAVRLRLDLDRAVAVALAESRRGGFLRRVYRELRHRPVHLTLAPRVHYSTGR